jgi:protein-tyrosine phosphatase
MSKIIHVPDGTLIFLPSRSAEYFMTKKSAILFVCMGNICRSPTAEAVFRRRAEAAGLASALHIDSAGTHGYHVGRPPDARSSQHAARRGYDLSAQRARLVTASDFEQFDHLLAMDRDNLALLEAACPPEHRHKLGLFMQFARNSGSDVVPDPYYGGGAGFDRVLDYIEDASDGLIEALRK